MRLTQCPICGKITSQPCEHPPPVTAESKKLLDAAERKLRHEADPRRGRVLPFDRDVFGDD